MGNKPVWVDKLPEAVEKSICYSDVLRYLGLSTNGAGSRQSVKKYIDELNLDTSHFNWISAATKRAGSSKRLPQEKVMCENSHYHNTAKKFARELIDYKCQLCGNAGEHNDMPLTLQLDHINGIKTDNRLENLRWLCPNCHTQTPTYGSRKRKNPIYITKNKINSSSKNIAKIRPRKVKKEPSKSDLEKLLNAKTPWVKIGEMYGVSDNAMRKWAKKFGLI